MKKVIAVTLILCSFLLLCSCQLESEPRGVRTVEINDNGELIIVFTDGTTTNAGVVKGEKGDAGADGVNGKDGTDGKNGADGKDGKDGAQGIQGLKGTEGRDGRSVESMTADGAGNLLVTYSDGKTETVELLGALYLFGGFLNADKTAAWALYNGGILYIGGEGETDPYADGSAPWSAVIPLISAVYVDTSGGLVLSETLLSGIDPDIVIYPDNAPGTTTMWVDMAVAAPIYATVDEVLSPEGATPIAELPLGSEIEVVEVKEEYASIIYNGEYAYIAKVYVRDNNGSVVYKLPDGFTQLLVTGESGANLRTYPDATYSENVYEKVPKNTVLNCTGVSMNGNWYRISYEGEVLYVRYNVVSPITEQQ